MKKILVIILISLCSIIVFGQNEPHGDTVIVRGEPIGKQYPAIILVVDSQKIELDSATSSNLDPKWIKKVEVLKDEKYIHTYGNTEGIIMIYPKKRYREKVLHAIRKE